MGTKRKVALWWRRRRNEYVVLPPGWKPEKHGEITFASLDLMVEFARASGLILRERERNYG